MKPTSPLVSCIMPTGNRRILARRAIEYFKRSTYPYRELVIVDGGREQLLGGHEFGIKYIRCPPEATIGVRRNMACMAAEGEIIMHWDDDDWHSPDRIERQVDALAHADMCGVRKWYVFDFARRAGLLLAGHERTMHGATFAYWRDVWDRVGPFPNLNIREDAAFLNQAYAGGVSMTSITSPSLWVYVRHPKAVSSCSDKLVVRGIPDELRELLADDFRFYDELAELAPSGRDPIASDGWRTKVPGLP
jgi:glycosyltransferase involved in cell wall biosynthesis